MLTARTGVEGEHHTGRYTALIAAECGGDMGVFLPYGACLVTSPSHHKLYYVEMPDLHRSVALCNAALQKALIACR